MHSIGEVIMHLLGKDVVQIGLDSYVFEKDPDGSVWIDLTDEGLDRKIVLRSDGTAVYMTQDIERIIQRVKDTRMWAEWYIRLGMNRIVPF
jgi:arginyl-tRNA synthetase